MKCFRKPSFLNIFFARQIVAYEPMPYDGEANRELHRCINIAIASNTPLPQTPRLLLYAPIVRRAKLLRAMGYAAYSEYPLGRRRADFLAFNPQSQTLYIADVKAVKYRVRAIGNRQLIHYAAAAIEKLDLPDSAKVVLAVFSPECPMPNPNWVLSAGEIRDWVLGGLPKYKRGSGKKSEARLARQRIYLKEWRAKNKDKKAEYQKQYMQDPENRKRMYEASARYAKRNRARLTARMREWRRKQTP